MVNKVLKERVDKGFLYGKELQYFYNKFYIDMRRYTWEPSVVEELVDFEIEVYKALPDINKVRSTWNKLKRDIKEVYVKDPGDFEKSVKMIDGIINNVTESSSYLDIYNTRKEPTVK